MGSDLSEMSQRYRIADATLQSMLPALERDLSNDK
jgi:hypothetical protein